MAMIGYTLASEEHSAPALVAQAAMAERAGFDALWISDHFHPWNDEQGQSPFVWAAIGALSQVTERMPVTTGVTCPIMRIHPAIIAQAAATAATLLPGRFRLGVGSGEALNEHIPGDHWPEVDLRLEMLEEAIALIRALWAGEMITYHGKHYTVENARIYSLPAQLPPIIISGLGAKATRLAGRLGDGYCSTQPDAELVALFRETGGGDKPRHGALKVCWSEDEAKARTTAHRLWANLALPGELAQELRLPRHFTQASSLVTEDMVAEKVACGPDPDRHLAAINAYIDAGFTEMYVQQIGPEQEGFGDASRRALAPSSPSLTSCGGRTRCGADRRVPARHPYRGA